MPEPLPEPIRQILLRAPHRAAFREIVRRLELLAPSVALAMADDVAPTLASWPVGTCRSAWTADRALGPIALRLSKVVTLDESGTVGIEGVLAEMPLLESVELIAEEEEIIPLLRQLPKRVKRLALSAFPTESANAWATSVAKELERFGTLDHLSLSVGAAAPALLRAAGATTVDTHLDDFESLASLDASNVRGLHFDAEDGAPSWKLLERFDGLLALTLPPGSAAAMAHLPTTLRSLRAPAIAGDATIAAFARCPSLEELSWNGNTFTSKGVRALVDSGAFERLTRIQLSEALGREEARELFALAAPARLHDLDLSGLALGDGTMRKVARAPAWTDRLVTLDLQDNELSSRGLADFLDALVERAEALASIAVDGNKLGPEVFDRLALLRKRGVAVDVDAPTTKPSRAPQPKDPAPTVALAWNRIETWLAKNKTVIPGLGSPAKRAAITKAAHLPGTLRALYALHDASPEADVLGLGRIVWWPLADVGGDALTEIDDRELAVFAAPVDEATREAGTLPSFDDDFDSLLAVAADTEEVVLVGRKGHVDVVAEHLGIALGRVADALEAGTKRFDDRGRLVEMKAPPPPPQNPAPVAKLSFIEEFAAAIIDRHVVELRPGATAKDLAKAFEEAVRSEDPRTHVKAVLAVFDTPLVDDVFVDDDELKTLAKSFARQFA